MELLLTIWLILVGIVIAIFSSYTALYYYYSRKPAPKYETKIFPTVSLVIPFFNEEIVLKKKIENTAKINYPNAKLEVIFLNDHSTDKSLEIIKKKAKILPFRWKIVNNENLNGKPNALNFLFPKLKSEITILTDADCIIDSSAIEKVVQNFQNPNVGGVSSKMNYNLSQDKANIEERSYRNFFDMWRLGESNLCSISICNGGLMSFRTKLLSNLQLVKPKGASADDTQLAFFMAKKGFRVLYDPESIVWDTTPPLMNERNRQKMRRARGIIGVYLRNYKMMGHGLFGRVIYPYAFLTHIISPYLVLVGTLIFPFIAIKNPYLLLVLPMFIIPRIGNLTFSFISTQIIMALSPFLAKGWNTAKSSREALAK